MTLNPNQPTNQSTHLSFAQVLNAVLRRVTVCNVMCRKCWFSWTTSRRRLV